MNMSSKGKIKLNGQPPGLAKSDPQQAARLSPRSKWRRAMHKLDKNYKPDVDIESVPLTERESLSRQNSSIINGRSSGHPSPSQIPNVVQYSTKETVVGEGTDSHEKGAAYNERDNDTTKDIDNGDRNKLNEAGSDLTKESSTVKSTINGSVVNSDTRRPSSRLGNDVSLKDSLTVPRSESSSSGAKDADGKSKKSSILPFGRETSKLSFDSRSQQYTAVEVSGVEGSKPAVLGQEDSVIKAVIPYMPLWVAVICLVMNIIVPGSGTILSGVTVFCCSEARVPAKYDQDLIFVMCMNTWVGVAQLFTVTFMLVGWFWSLAWGVTMIILSLEHRRELEEQRQIELKRRALEAFGTSLSGRIPGFT